MRALLFALALLPLPAWAGVQAELDALPSEGGVVELPCGIFDEGGAIIEMPSNVILRGAGPCTVVPPIVARDNHLRQYNLRIESLTIDGALADLYIGLDWRNVSWATARDVWIMNVDTGVLVYLDALYNVLDRVWIVAEVDCLEILEIGNETKWLGGKCDGADLGIWVRGANNVTIRDVAVENVETCVRLSAGAVSVSLIDLRCEAAAIWLDEDIETSQTTLMGNYLSGVH